jgi:fibronectin-binding autotransporter adhesin
MKNTSCHLLVKLVFAALTATGFVTSASAQIGRANNTSPFDTNAAWTGGVAPNSSQVAGFSSINTATSSTSTITAGVNFQIGGIAYTNEPGTNLTIGGGAGSSITIGASGIDTSAGTRVLTIGSTAPVSLSANQTWTTGTAAASTSQIVVNSVVSGAGQLTINGTSGSPLSPVYLSALNTFSGGVILNAGGSLRLGSGTPTFSGNLPTSSSIGTGNLTINGGTIFGAGGTLAAPTTTITDNFAINSGTSALNGRLTIAGGTLDLSGGTRTVSAGRFTTAVNALGGGQESVRFLQTAGAPTISVSNGTLGFVRGATGSATDFVSVAFGTGSNFAAGSGLSVGQNVITTMATGNPFGTTSGAQPHVTVESGGYFNMSDATASRSPIIRTLSGSGTVTSLANSAAPATSTLTINSQSGDSATFSGSIVEGTTLNGTLGTSAANVTVAVVKNGSGTQIFSGTSSYSGTTTVSAGTLLVNGSLTGTGNVSVAVGATLGGSGTIGGDTTVNGTLSAGNSPGLLVFNNPTAGFADLTLGSTSNSIFEINGLTRGVTYDAVNVEGILTMNGTLTLDFGFVPDVTDTFDLFNFANQSGAFTSVVFADAGFAGSFDPGTGILSLSAIPEPGTYALLTLGMVSLWVLRRRNSRVS